MWITKGYKTIEIPNLALFVGAIILDNVVVNICKTVSYKNFVNGVKEVLKKRRLNNG